MKFVTVRRFPFVLALAPAILYAQIGRQPANVPLQHWAAPAYWQPSQREAEAMSLRPEAVTAQLPSPPLVFVAITPCRLVDTRPGQGFSGFFGPPSLNPNSSRTFPIQSSGSCSIPSTALAYSLDVSVLPPGPLGYITVYPTGQPLPLAATLTDVQGVILTNAAIVPAGNNGSIDVYAFNATDLVIDINGYYVSATDTVFNTSFGVGTLASNSTGTNNTAIGSQALQSNTSGTGNTALGSQALARNVTGSNNIGIGVSAAGNVSGSNSNNIHIGNLGLQGDNAVVRIGTGGTHTSFFLAGVRDVTTGNNDAIPVVIDSGGQLGTISSSRRFKEDIQDMGDASSGLMRLRPVTFRYQKQFADGSKPIQYGLIAEEVQEVYPDLVAHSADGQIDSVKYQVLDSMLLNEVQREHAQIVTQTDQIRRLEQLVKQQQERLAKLEEMFQGTSNEVKVH